MSHGVTMARQPKVALGESGVEKNSKLKENGGGGYRSDTSCVLGHFNKVKPN